MYKINKVVLPAPETGKWEGRKNHGENGLANPIYGSYRKFEIQWSYLTPAEFALLNSAFLYSQNSGSVVVELPTYGASTYSFTEYSGCYLSDLQIGEYYEEHYGDITLVVNKVRA